MQLNRNRLTLIFLCLILAFCPPLWAGNPPPRVLVIPFKINSDQDLAFLQRGVTDMLITRLAQTGKVDLVSFDETGKKTAGEFINIDWAIAQGKKFKADYVTFGSITVLGNRISTDAIMVDVSQEKPVLAFNEFADNQSDLFDHVTLFATKINQEILEPGIPIEPAPVPKAAEKPVPVEEVKPTVPVVTKTAPSPVVSTPITEEPSDSWASRDFSMAMIGVALGDLDGDGSNETVFASAETVYIHRYENGRFINVAEVTAPRKSQILGVDIADINKNGRSEIFVTNLPKKHSGRVHSFVLEWDGAQFNKIADSLNWYFRVITVPERGQILLGQQRSGDDAIFSGGVYEMNWSNGRYQPLEAIALPKRVNLYGFTRGDALNNGEEMLVFFTLRDYVRVLDSNNKEIWVSGERYGGGSTFISAPSNQNTFGDIVVKDRLYLSPRIFVADLDGNGRKEIILPHNLDSAGRHLARVRAYSSGQVHGLEWDGKGFIEVWKSKEFGGYIADYTIGDLNNDGRADELVLAVVPKTTSVFSGDKKSYIFTLRVDQ